MDGTAKGGVVLAIRDLLHLPVRFLGLGEKPADLRPFDINAFLMGITKRYRRIMISKLDANDLFDVYGDLLTKRQREILSLYYEEDFSYTEISEELEIFVQRRWIRFIELRNYWKNMKRRLDMSLRKNY